VAHEFLIDVSEFKHINEVDISKRLIDYNFHPPTMSWPKKSTLMIEPTESESTEELNRFINALISIRREIEECPELLKNAPHPISLVKNKWTYPYTMQEAFFPLPELEKMKLWPSVSRVNDVFGDQLMYNFFKKND
jgi:glycine dehydrogenase